MVRWSRKRTNPVSNPRWLIISGCHRPFSVNNVFFYFCSAMASICFSIPKPPLNGYCNISIQSDVPSLIAFIVPPIADANANLTSAVRRATIFMYILAHVLLGKITIKLFNYEKYQNLEFILTCMI